MNGANNEVCPNRSRRKSPSSSPQKNVQHYDTPKIHTRRNKTQAGWKVLFGRLSIQLRSKNPRTLLGISLVTILFLYTLSTLSITATSVLKTQQRSQKTASGGLDTSDLRLLGYTPKPRSVGCHFDENTGVVNKFKRLNVYEEKYPTLRTIPVTSERLKAQKALADSNDYKHRDKDPFETKECTALHDWQETSFPSCNYLHEYDLNEIRHGNAKIVGSGYWRDVWMVKEHDGSKRALKTMIYEHDFEARNYERHRKDAVAMERLTKSPHIVDIYGFCGNSGIFEFAPGGDINDVIWPPGGGKPTKTRLERLQIATQVAIAMADMHNSDEVGRPAIAHTDITTSQFILIDGFYKLNDFNRARFMRKWRKDGKPCGYTVGNNPGKFRAPEEYAYEIQDEKIDIYSMGNVFYVLLTDAWAFERIQEKEAQEKIMDGVRPFISKAFRESEDPSVKALIEAMHMCWEQEPEDRATAIEVRDYLISVLKKLNPSFKF
mmetsp:Transcript_55943/g.83372  ORF Transcript_55943/g.83372 Transcript_55943/m.83372 type:complete len:491 (+) Transcript_55943:95-1567(+)